MAHNFTIDYIDVADVFGLEVIDQGYNELIEWPAFKPIPYNDWGEDDGIEPDLSSPKLASREVKVSLAGRATLAQVEALMGLLTEQKMHTLSYTSVRARWRMRFVEAEPMVECGGLRFLTLTFAEDVPEWLNNTRPTSNISPATDYLWDNNKFTDYGVRILEGTRDSVTRIPDAKELKKYSVSGVNGDILAGGAIRYQAYDATLRCLMRASSLSELWENYCALFNAMSASGAHYLYVDAVGKSYPCYYQSCKIQRFYPTDKIWLEFDIMVKVFGKPDSVWQ